MKKYLLFSVLIFSALTAGYAGSKQEFKPGVFVGDGKAGRSAVRWSQKIKEGAVSEVRVTLHRTKGDGDTFVNLRFGPKGNTLDGGKRVYLKDGKQKVITWKVGGTRPGGKPLVLIAYDGEVKLSKVVIHYQ